MRRIESVEALRGLAALSVSWFHFTWPGLMLKDGWLASSGAYGWLGVDVFFVISGFVIPYSMHRAGYRAPRDVWPFLGKRLLRLQPPYLAAVALTVLLLYAVWASPGSQGVLPQVEPVQVLLHAVYLPHAFGYPWLNAVFWSLAIEVQYYALAAILFPLLVHPSARVRLVLLTALCGVAAFVPGEGWVFHYTALFSFGMLAFQEAIGLVNRWQYVVLLFALAALALTGLEAERIAAGVAAALIITLIEIPHTAPLAFLGTVSYSYYLVQMPIGVRVVNLGGRLAHSLPAQLLVLFAAVGISLLAAWVMYRLVERPAQRWSATLRYGDRNPGTPIS